MNDRDGATPYAENLFPGNAAELPRKTVPLHSRVLTIRIKQFIAILETHQSKFVANISTDQEVPFPHLHSVLAISFTLGQRTSTSFRNEHANRAFWLVDIIYINNTLNIPRHSSTLTATVQF